MYYEEVFKALNKNKIKYLVVGGIAVNLYGLQRLTRDLDLMIDISEENLQKFVQTISKLGYRTKIAIEEWKGLTGLTFYHEKDKYKSIDIFLKNPIDFKKAYAQRKIIRLGKIKVSCTSFEDLIAMKEKSGRDRDWIDIGYLKKLGKPKQ